MVNVEKIIIFETVEDFMNKLDKPTMAKITRIAGLLKKFGDELKMPHSKKINKDIHELRIRGKQEIRILYSFYQGKVFLLHGFIKKSDKLPKKELETAVNRLKGLTG